MPRWVKVLIATILPLATGALAWVICAMSGVDGNTTGIVVGLAVLAPGTPMGLWVERLAHTEPANTARGVERGDRTEHTPPADTADRPRDHTDQADPQPAEPGASGPETDATDDGEPDGDTWRKSINGSMVEQSVWLDIDIDPDGWATLSYHHELLNLSETPLTRIARELWFENTAGPLTITPTGDCERRLMIQRVHDTANLTKFACQISPPLQPGESTTVGFTCKGGQFVEDHYWRQSINRPTGRYTINVRHRGAGQLVRCTATEDNADGSQRSAEDGLVWDFEGDDIVISLTREHLHPNQAVTLRWDKPR